MVQTGAMHECPGPKTPARPEMVECPQCGEDVEIWTDETSAKCPSCSTTVMRPGAKPEAIRDDIGSTPLIAVAAAQAPR